jgi:hypothetical protein
VSRNRPGRSCGGAHITSGTRSVAS